MPLAAWAAKETRSEVVRMSALPSRSPPTSSLHPASTSACADTDRHHRPFHPTKRNLVDGPRGQVLLDLVRDEVAAAPALVDCARDWGGRVRDHLRVDSKAHALEWREGEPRK